MAHKVNLLGEVASLSKSITVEGIQAEIDALTALIDSAVGDESGKVNFEDIKVLKDRVDKCIATLKLAQTELVAKAQVRAKTTALADLIKDNPDRSEAISEAKNALKIAEQALSQTKAEIADQATRRDIRLAIMEGYAIVTLLREKITGEVIDYKIMSMGVDGQGQQVLLEAHPTLAEVLSSASLDSRSFSLRITMTQHQFKKALADLDKGEQVTSLRNSVLKKMTRVQLTDEQANMWETFVQVKEALQDIEGARTNFGQIGESFMEYYYNGMDAPTMLDSIYTLLEKGRNNLAYYLGPDVTGGGQLWQVKALSTYSSTGRADIATLTNVLNPLKTISEYLANAVTKDIRIALNEFFRATKEGQGDRSFNEKVGENVREAISTTLQNMK